MKKIVLAIILVNIIVAMDDQAKRAAVLKRQTIIQGEILKILVEEADYNTKQRLVDLGFMLEFERIVKEL